MFERYAIADRDSVGMSPSLLERDFARIGGQRPFHVDGRVDTLADRLDFNDSPRPVDLQVLERRANRLHIGDVLQIG